MTERRLHHLYQNVLDQSKEIESFFSSATKKGIEQQMSDDFESLQRIARCNYIKTFAFDKYFPLPLSEEKLIGSFCSQEKQFFNMIGNPQFQQSISYGIRQIYEPEQAANFAEAVRQYFQHRNDLFPIFVYVLFPAIYGFFLSEEHQMYAFDFLFALMDLDGELFKPFFVSFFMSANSFTDIFWHKFFKLVKGEERFKPSIAQLYEYLKSTLTDTCVYLTPYQVQLAISFMINDPVGFSDCFFRRFLFTTFRAWVSYNPSESSSKVTEEQLDQLFSFFFENPESPYFQEILRIFQQKDSVFSISELVSFVEHAPIKKVTCLLSPMEAKMLSEIFISIPDISPSIYPADKINDETGIFLNFNAGSIEVYLRQKKNVNQENEELIYHNRSLDDKVFYKDLQVDKEERQEIERSWNIITQICGERGVDPLHTLFTCNEYEPDDTIHDKLAKKKIYSRVNDNLKKYVIGTYNKNIATKQNQFEEFLLQQNLSNLINAMKGKLIRYGEVIEQLIFPKLKNINFLIQNNLFTTNIIRLQMTVDEDSKQFDMRSIQKEFDGALRDYTIKIPKFQEFLMERESFFKAPILTLSRLDELSLGDRFFILYHVYTQITILTEPMSKDPEFDDPIKCTNALFARIVSESKCRSFLRTFVCICYYKSENSDRFQLLPEDMVNVWNKIQAFIVSLIQDASFDQVASQKILKFIN